MEKSQFTYVTYIKASPENVWNAITDPTITPKYWQHKNISDWQPGSKWKHQSGENGSILLVGKVIETSAPKHLVITWAEPQDEAQVNKHTRVTFEIEPVKDLDVVRLTVKHDQLEPGSGMLHDITEGWPKVLSSMKTFLETGQPLPTLW